MTILTVMSDFQLRVANWMMATFTMEETRGTEERNRRFLEESLELVQSLGCTQQEAHVLVEYVFNRPKGDTKQELGGVLITLSALCNAVDITDMLNWGEWELRRCWQNIETIRNKQADKPKSIHTNASYLSRMRERYDPEDKAARANAAPGYIRKSPADWAKELNAIDFDEARIPSPIDLIYQQENSRSLHDISSSLFHLHTKVNKIMATQQALADALTTANNKLLDLGTTLDKIGTETSGLVSGTTALQAQVATLTDELTNLETTPAVDAALAAVQATVDSLTAKAKTVDDLVPDTPVINQDPPGTTAGTTKVDPAANPQSPDIPK